MNPIDIQQQLADQRRGRYVRVSDTDRRQLIETYKKGEDFIALAKKLNIKRSTARSILRTFIDEGRVSAKQRAGTRLRFITEEEAEMIREMKRRHPLITIGQIQMRLQRTSNRVLSKASISRILTNSIRLGKRAKRGNEGDDNSPDANNDLMQLSSDENTGGAIYIDDEIDDNEDGDVDGDDEMLEKNSSLQNLDDFQRFMLRKTSVNGDESNGNEDLAWDKKDQYNENDYSITYPTIASEEDDDLSEMDENETKSSIDIPPIQPLNDENPPTLNENENWTSVKTEPVCVFVNRHFDSSDSEQTPAIDEGINKNILNTQSTANRRIKVCPICGEQNFSRLSHHLTVAHDLNRQESLTLLAYADRNPTNQSSSMATVSSSSPRNQLDKSPQQTPITINTNNQQITSSASSPIINNETDNNNTHPILTTTTTSSSSPNDQQLTNNLTADGKKRLLCPNCDTWVLNLTDHLIKKHHLISKQERLPFLRLARNRYSATPTLNTDNKLSSSVGGGAATNSFLISPNENNSTKALANKKCQNIINKYRKKVFNTFPALPSSSSLPLLTNEASSTNLLTTSKSISLLKNANKDIAIHQKFEQRLSVFRQQFAVTVALQNSLMQQMELLQRSFVSIEEEWNDMKKEIVESIS